jgi:hypothetical protein
MAATAVQGAVFSSQSEPACAVSDCDQSVVPGSTLCGVHQADGDKSPGSPNGGPDGSLSDGTNAPSDPNGGWQDGSVRKMRHGPARTQGLARDAAHRATSQFRSEQIDDNTLVVSGVAIVYGTRTVISDRFGKFGETIQRGAAAHLVGGDVRLLANHDGLPLARTVSGTLTLAEKSFGVTFGAALDLAAPMAQDVISGIRRGDLNGCSFAFTVNDDGDRWNSTMSERVITRFSSLPEVSVVTFPAYEATTVTTGEQARAAHDRAIAAQRVRLAKRRGLG